MPYQQATAKLQELIHRQDKVLTVMHPPSAALARVMEAAGAEAGFSGTGGVVGSYTGMGDVGVATMNECVTIAGWIARSVRFPVIMDGDTGHGGIMAVRRMIEECINAGIAGVRIDDQRIEAKRSTGSAGIEVESLDVVLARYRAAVDRKRELDPNFVIMAQCYTREAANGGLEDAIRRMRAYKEVAEVDWVQFTSPRSIEEIKMAQEAVEAPFSVMTMQLPHMLSLEEHQELGLNVAWYAEFPHTVTWVALDEFMRDFQQRGYQAWLDFREQHKDNPYIDNPLIAGRASTRIGEFTGVKQREMEEKYFSPEMLAKYEKTARK